MVGKMERNMLRNLFTIAVFMIVAPLQLHAAAKPSKQEKIILAANARLLKAAKSGNCSEIDSALRWGAHIECVDKRGRQPLYLATKNNRLKAMQKLLEYGADKNAEVHRRNSTQWPSPFDIAVFKNNISAQEILLKHGFSKEDLFYQLQYMVMRGRIEVMPRLVSYGAPTEWRGLKIHLASVTSVGGKSLKGKNKQTRLDAVNALLQQGACVDMTLKGHGLCCTTTPLESALACEDRSLVEVLLEAGADVALVTNPRLYSMLISMCKVKHEKLMQLFNEGTPLPTVLQSLVLDYVFSNATLKKL
jgi:ankyrin repeat protein